MNAHVTQTWKEIFYFIMHSTHFIYSYMASDIWLRTTQIMREKACYHHNMGYSLWLETWDLLCAPSHRQDSTYHRFTPTVKHWLEIPQWVHHEGLSQWNIILWPNTLPQRFILLLTNMEMRNAKLCKMYNVIKCQRSISFIVHNHWTVYDSRLVVSSNPVRG